MYCNIETDLTAPSHRTHKGSLTYHRHQHHWPRPEAEGTKTTKTTKQQEHQTTATGQHVKDGGTRADTRGKIRNECGNGGLSLLLDSTTDSFFSFLSMCHKTYFLFFCALLKRRNITPLKWRNKKRQRGPSHTPTYASCTIIKLQQTPTSRKRKGTRQTNAQPSDQRGNRCTPSE